MEKEEKINNKRQDYKLHKGKFEIYFNQEWKEIVVDNIEFIDVLGEGANGVVLKGIQQPFDRVVATKFWLPNKNSKDAKVSKEQYFEEIKKIAKLRDQRIIQVFTGSTISNQQQGIFYSVMEYVKGCTLNDWLNSYKSNNRELRNRIAKEILETIKKCHDLNIYHGDLHCKNIIISEEETVHILDFGTSYFSKKFKTNMTEERESYLLADTIFKLINENEMQMFCEFKLPKKVNQKDYLESDVRLYKPEYIRDTLYYLIDIIEIMDNSLDDYAVRVDIAQAIKKCHCLKLERVLEYLAKNNSDNSFRIFLIVLDEELESSALDGKGMVVEWISAKVYYDLLKANLNNNGRESNFEYLFELPVNTASTYISVANWFIYKSNLDFKKSTELAMDIFLKDGYYSFFELLRFMMWVKLCQVYKNENTPNILLKNILLRNVREIEDNEEEYEFFMKHVEYISENHFIGGPDNKKLSNDIREIHSEIANNPYDEKYFSDVYNSDNRGMK